MSKKVIRIFGMPSHSYVDRVSGVDFVRIIQPMKALDGYKDEDTEFKVTVYNHAENESFDWRDVCADNDIIYFNYTTNDVGYAVMGTMAQKYKCKLVCDVDDDIFNIMPGNPAYDGFKKGTWGLTVFTTILNDVSYVTCTNNHLRHSLQFNTKKYGDKIAVFPNYIDLSLYKHRSPFKDTDTYTALHFGSSTHHQDLYSPPFEKAINRIMYEYPNFTIKTIGAFIPSYRMKWGKRYQQGFGDTDLMKWIKMMPEHLDDADFMVVPLVNNTYNLSKSGIKYLEASSYKIPGVWQDLRQYREIIKDGVNGYLASTEEEWYTKIKSLLENTKLRKTMGGKAFETVEKDHQIQNQMKSYASFFKRVLSSP